MIGLRSGESREGFWGEGRRKQVECRIKNYELRILCVNGRTMSWF